MSISIGIGKSTEGYILVPAAANKYGRRRKL